MGWFWSVSEQGNYFVLLADEKGAVEVGVERGAKLKKEMGWEMWGEEKLESF